MNLASRVRQNASMPNIAALLKSEISRVARKELRSELEPLKKASVQQRRTIAALRKQVDQMEKRLRQGAKRSNAVGEPSREASDLQGRQVRFSATRLAAHRAKLGLSAADYGQLVGVSGQSVYKWEQGNVRPRASQIQSLAAVRSLSKREAMQRLEAQSAG